MSDNEQQASATVALVDVYAINDNNNVFLTVQGSDNDSCVSDVEVPGNFHEGDIVGSLTRNLGPGSDLKGKTLTVTSLVAELSGDNDTSMKLILTGGPSDFSHTSEKSVAGTGDSVLYTADIVFI